MLDDLTGTLTCPDPSECDECPFLQRFLEELGVEHLWACSICLPKTEEFTSLGFYTSGMCDLCEKRRILLQVCL